MGTIPTTTRRRHYGFLLASTCLSFVGLVFTIFLAYKAQIELQQLSVDIRQLYASWTSVVSTAKSLVSSSEPVSQVFGTFSTKLDGFRATFQESEARLRSASTASGILAQRIGDFVRSMDFGVKMLSDIEDWLGKLGAKGLLDRSELQDFREGSRHVEVTGYDQLLQLWVLQRVRDLDELFDAPFAEMDSSLNAIIVVDFKDISRRYLLWGAGFSLTFTLALIWLFFRMRSMYRTLDDQALRLEDLNTGLEDKVQNRTQYLEQTLNSLERAQSQLLESEKLAQLGTLVAGVAHEINTPIGIGVTAASYQIEAIKKLKATDHFSRLSDTGDQGIFKQELDSISDAGRLILSNLQRADDIISAFKQLSVDQAGDSYRTFEVSEIVRQTLFSLSPQLKNSVPPCQVSTVFGPNLVMDSYPGALSQVLTNLIQNSLVHAFPDRDRGTIAISATLAETSGGPMVSLVYSDDGRGIHEEHLPHIFEPFFTTRRQHGGSGLGLSIVYNLVRNKLGGTLTCKVEPAGRPSTGTTFEILLPLTVPKAARPHL